MKSGIYKILNLLTGKFYIGSAINLNQRFNEHKSHLKRNIHKNKYLQAAWNKYWFPEEVFKFIILELCELEFLVKLEQNYINITNCCNREIGYNLNPTANSQLGYKWNDESRKRQSIIQTGKKMSKEAIAKTVAGNKGQKRSNEQRARMSASQKGKLLTEEHRAKLIEAGKLRRGKPRSEISKQKLRETWVRKKAQGGYYDGN